MGTWKIGECWVRMAIPPLKLGVLWMDPTTQAVDATSTETGHVVFTERVAIPTTPDHPPGLACHFIHYGSGESHAKNTHPA